MTDPALMDHQRLPEIYDMRSLSKRLVEFGFDKVQAIPFASVPIVKFECEIDGVKIQADLNTNERLGETTEANLVQHKTSDVLTLDPFPPFVLLLQAYTTLGSLQLTATCTSSFDLSASSSSFGLPAEV